MPQPSQPTAPGQLRFLPAGLDDELAQPLLLDPVGEHASQEVA